MGKIIKPHGILGEVKVKLFNSKSKTLKVGQTIWILDSMNKSSSYIIERLSLLSEKSKIKFRDIDDRNAAELIRNSILSVSRNDFPELGIDEFYLIDLIGYSVLDQNGVNIGIISDIMENPANEIIVITNNNKEYLIPFINEFVKFFDHLKKEIMINVIDGLIDN